jgi:hypothetical protein
MVDYECGIFGVSDIQKKTKPTLYEKDHEDISSQSICQQVHGYDRDIFIASCCYYELSLPDLSDTMTKPDYSNKYGTNCTEGFQLQIRRGCRKRASYQKDYKYCIAYHWMIVY